VVLSFVLKFRKVLSWEKLHSAQAVSDSLVRSPLASGMWICLKNEWDVNPRAHQLLAEPQKERQLWNSYFMELNRTLMESSCLSEDRKQRGHLKPHAYLEIRWNCEGHSLDALKVTGVEYWWVCTHPSGLGWRKPSISVHLHTAQVVPVDDLIEEHEKHGAGDFRVSWEVEVVMSVSTLQCSCLP